MWLGRSEDLVDQPIGDAGGAFDQDTGRHRQTAVTRLWRIRLGPSIAHNHPLNTVSVVGSELPGNVAPILKPQ